MITNKCKLNIDKDIDTNIDVDIDNLGHSEIK